MELGWDCTVAFCSQRGGVGKSTALAQIGLELVRRGRTVLLVDFALHAPALAHFPRFGAAAGKPGLVEWLTASLHHERLPLRNYLTEVSAKGDGKLWLLPAGREDDAFWAQLGGIDWNALYEEQEGYFLFEELRRQWQEAPEPDYVLIDTSPGVTPYLGIAARQLADHVLLLHAGLEEQEALTELEALHSQIAREAEITGRSLIEQTFVASKAFTADRDFPSEVETEHGFFEAQVIPFSSRGAAQVAGVGPAPTRGEFVRNVRLLTNSLVTSNFARDKRAARFVLWQFESGAAESGPWFSGRLARYSLAEALDTIALRFLDEPDLLAQTASCLFSGRRFSKALETLAMALEIAPDDRRLLWQRASYLDDLDDRERTIQALLRVIEVSSSSPQEPAPTDALDDLGDGWLPEPWQDRFAPPSEFLESDPRIPYREYELSDGARPLLRVRGADPYLVSALWRLRQLAPETWESLSQTPAVAGLPLFVRQRLAQGVAPVPEEVLGEANEALEPLLHRGEWERALALLQTRRNSRVPLDLSDAAVGFLAGWAAGDSARETYFAGEVRDLFEARLAHLSVRDLPFMQVMALVHWRKGEPGKAARFLDMIADYVGRQPEFYRIFSYWCGRERNRDPFLEDCANMRLMIRGAIRLTPPVLR